MEPGICSDCGALATRMVRGMCRTCHMRRYRREKPAIVRAADARSKAKHAAEVKERKARYAREHPEVQRRADKKRRLNNPEGRREVSRNHYRRFPERYLEKWQRRHALKQGATVAPVNQEAIYTRDAWICQLCNRPVERGQESLDHIVPLSKGGTHEPRNVQLAHRRCNRVRSNRGPAQIRLLP